MTPWSTRERESHNLWYEDVAISWRRILVKWATVDKFSLVLDGTSNNQGHVTIIRSIFSE